MPNIERTKILIESPCLAPTDSSRAETEKYFRNRRNAQELVVACGLCPWTAEGLAGEVLEAQHTHRQEHGSKGRGKISRRTVRNLNSFVSQELTSEDQEEIEAEIARRRRLHGLEAA